MFVIFEPKTKTKTSMTVLFTCAGRRNYLIQYFKEAIGEGGTTIAVDIDPTASALVAADIALTVPSVTDSNYVTVLLGILKDFQVNLLIPLNDIELPIISAHRERLEAYGTKVVISQPETIDLCGDKWKTFAFFENLKIPTPKSYIKIQDVLLALMQNRIQFPIILKPRWGFGSVGIEEVESEEELQLAYQLLLIKINRTSMSIVANHTSPDQIIFQEKIKGQEYGIDILNDFDGNHHSAYARKKLAMRSGETDKAISVIDSRFTKMAKIIGKATRHIGCMDCDFFVTDGVLYFLEMNPRFGGGYPFSHESGVNMAAIYLKWLEGDKNTDILKYTNYNANQIFSKYDNIIKVNEAQTAKTKKVTVF